MEKTKLCVIGDPVAHSLSPVIHNTILSNAGLPYEYGRVEVKAGDTAAFLEEAKAAGYGGFNATMPHKTALLGLVDELDADAALFGAVNTVVIQGNTTRGCNTDGRGFLKMLLDNGFDPAGKTITVLGAGGAARAVVLKLAKAGAARIFVCSRTAEKAEKLAEMFPAQITACSFDGQALSDCALFSDLVVNATPMGMNGVATRFADFLFLEGLAKTAPVCDLIYSPLETDLLRRARELGHPTINGLGMLIHQAIFALEEFTGTQIDADTVLPQVRRALERELEIRNEELGVRS